jgi:hypothetical protein
MATGVDVLGDVETEEATRAQWMSVSGVTQWRRQLRNRRIERSGEVSVYMMNGNFVMRCGCDSKPSAIIRRLSEQFLFVRPEVIELSPISEDGRSRTAMLDMSALVRVNASIWQEPETCFSCSLPSRHDGIMLELGDFGCSRWEPYPQNPFGSLLRYLSNDVLAWSPPALMCKWCWQSGAPLLCFEPDPEFLNDDFFNAYVQLLWPGENATCGENAGKLWMSRTTDAWDRLHIRAGGDQASTSLDRYRRSDPNGFWGYGSHLEQPKSPSSSIMPSWRDGNEQLKQVSGSCQIEAFTRTNADISNMAVRDRPSSDIGESSITSGLTKRNCSDKRRMIALGLLSHPQRMTKLPFII